MENKKERNRQMAGEKKTFSGKKREEFQGAGKKKETGKQEKPGQDRKKKNRNNAASVRI